MKEPIRILQVVTTMNLGGLENFLMNIYRNINREKIQFDFLMHRHEKSVFDDEIEALGGKIFKLGPITPKRYFKYQNELKAFLKNHPEYQIIHSHINENNAMVLSAAQDLRLKIRIAHSHASATTSKYKFLRELLIKRLSQFTTHRIACSEAAGKWLFKDNSFIIMNNSIDTRKYTFDIDARSHFRKSLQIKDSETVIGNVSRFSNVKNHTFLLEVFDCYCTLNPNAKLILVGDGELRSVLEQKIKELKINDKVIFTGAIKNAEAYLNTMDVYLFPSLFEGMPLALIEAQTNGLPILMSDSISKDVELTDLVTRKSLQHSARDWAEKIVELEGEFKSNNRLKYVQKIVDAQFDINESVDKLEEFYIKLSK